ncbi:uncharacterized protein [Triticum aestivum]|uniref:uncharacterized protein n=1 Tax=Triticum aestivum TaxID=4565 RepID=UPI001D02B806|nr:uncharacterized protein LOC123156897 [Triticum aestivum]
MALHCYINGRHCIVEGVHWGLESMAYDMVCYVHLASGGSGSQDDGRGSSARVSNDKCVCCQPVKVGSAKPCSSSPRLTLRDGHYHLRLHNSGDMSIFMEFWVIVRCCVAIKLD